MQIQENQLDPVSGGSRAPAPIRGRTIRPEQLDPQPAGDGFWSGLWSTVKDALTSMDPTSRPETGVMLRKTAGDIARDVPQTARDVWTSLNPLAGWGVPGQPTLRESQAAGGRVLGKIGDVSAFTTGGFHGPFAGGPEMTPAYSRDVPGGPMGTRPAPFGQRMIRGPGVPAAPPPGPWSGRGPVPPQARTEPPPLRPGAPVGAPSPLGQVTAITRAGRPGLRATPSSVSSQGSPAPAPPGRSGGTSVPAAGAIAHAGEPDAPNLITALVRNDSAAVNRATLSRFKQATRPGIGGLGTAGSVDHRNQRILDASDRIIANRDNITLTDAAGRPMKAGSMPRSLDQFVQAIQQIKDRALSTYSGMAQRAGGAPVRISLQPAIDTLRRELQKPAATGAPIGENAQAVADANRLLETWSKAGSYDPVELEGVIKSLNRVRGEPNSLSAEIMQPVVAQLRGDLDRTIAQSQGPGYAQAKAVYSDMRAIEDWVVKAAEREARNIPGGLSGRMENIAAAGAGSGAGLITALVHGGGLESLAAAATIGAAGKGLPALARWYRAPNTAVQMMFSRRAANELRQIRRGGMAAGIPGTAAGLSAAGRTGFAVGAGTAAQRFKAQQKVSQIQRDLYSAKRRGDTRAAQTLQAQLPDAIAEYHRLRAPVP